MFTATTLIFPSETELKTAIHTLTTLPVPGRLLPACRLAAEEYDDVRKILSRT
ncbi:hypothetical protein ACFDC9_14555 [Escherichia coli]|uniref:Uncharacterized protein n=1 Tax=Escherichia coli TaxID=562 RepID=A0AAW7UP07_ECOLX|nr:MULTISPECIES: hypothetical protein [Enterobacteriaceae]EEZ8897807.1 hypothetical protein [Escherichia coli O104]EHV49338.1 hypothetical protein ECDEC6B_5602 [Escherichia coli DEC6B]EHV68631.1 hypothetical protein ECDEC6D_3607 [Escherichia coli DEC6D]HCA6862460.1 hypothetical protein [Escherichia coli O21:H2]HDQ6478289.1 hypothetical protein [Escherichia coli O104:H4 str. 11-3798]HDQ7007629.1 hypothetical protein [Escherichia coli O104:H4 str. Ec11-5537]HDQ7045777.1 hypothetical protein [E